MKYVNLGCGNRFHPAWTNIDMVSTGPGVIAHDLSRKLPLDDATCDLVYHSHVLEHIRRSQVPFFLQECRRILNPGGIIRVVVPDLEAICRLYLDSLEKALLGDTAAARKYQWLVMEMYEQTVREHYKSEMWDYLFKQNMRDDPFIRSRIGDIRDQAGAQPTTPAQPSILKRAARQIVENLLWLKPVSAWKIGRFRLSGEVHQWMYDRFSLSQLLREGGFINPTQHTAVTSKIPDWNRFELDTVRGQTAYKPDSLYMEAERPS